ncbi:MAG TPA: hypothetical protein DD417_16470 [Elusimicrobia bacterium]|nr:MAG: hypothetical protein A2040_08910 [Rhodocyclales bacterium GWA2_65_19]HBL18296.1 hypothetical protein [Elusimicrobiota bacterium]
MNYGAVTAFQTLSKAAKADFLAHLVSDRDLRHDLMDIALIEKRQTGKARPFRDYLAERSGKN